MLAFFNSLILTIAASPYFVFVTGCCSIASVITLRALWTKLFASEESFQINAEDSAEIVNLLIERISIKPDKFVIATVQSDSDYEKIDIFPKNIDKLKSFLILPPNSEIMFYLLKGQKELYLYAALSYMEMDFKCIAKSDSVSQLTELHNLLSQNHVDTPDIFMQKIINSLKS